MKTSRIKDERRKKLHPANISKPKREAEEAKERADELSAKTVLLAVTGMSPAILTETVWALAAENPPIVPEEVIVITTTRGKADIYGQLLTPLPAYDGRSVWEALRAQVLGRPTVTRIAKDPERLLQFGTPRVIELPDRRRGIKTPAEDLRSPQDNLAAGDYILEEVRRLVENMDVRVVASIAGGRKTMGALLYACMSLLGRESDRVTHVLVNEPFDICRGFYFPEQPDQELRAAREGAVVMASEARIELADIPFVPLRKLFERDLLHAPGGFAGLVELGKISVRERARDAVRLEICEDAPRIIVNNCPVDLSVAEYILIWNLAKRASKGEPALGKYGAAAEYVAAAARELYAARNPEDFSDWRAGANTAGGGTENIDEWWIRKNLSSMRHKLRKAGRDTAALNALLPETRRYSLDLDGARILFRGK